MNMPFREILKLSLHSTRAIFVFSRLSLFRPKNDKNTSAESIQVWVNWFRAKRPNTIHTTLGGGENLADNHRWVLHCWNWALQILQAVTGDRTESEGVASQWSCCLWRNADSLSPVLQREPEDRRWNKYNLWLLWMNMWGCYTSSAPRNTLFGVWSNASGRRSSLRFYRC